MSEAPRSAGQDWSTGPPTEPPPEDVVIVGAGPSGLAVAGALVARGIRPRLLDASTTSATAWRGRHEDLHLNTHRRFSGLPGMPIPRRMGAYPRRTDFVAYLEAYERELGLTIERGVPVTRIDAASSGWRIRTRAGSLLGRHVVVATGVDRVPELPAFAHGSPYEGQLIHASDFGHARDYAGKRVLIVGAGNSGIDLANHLSHVDHRAMWLSSRSGAHVLPRRLLGVPTQPIGVLMRKRSAGFQDRSARLMSRWAFGDLEKLGLATPPKGAFSRNRDEGIAPAIDGGFVRMLRSGRIEVVPEVERLESRRAVLVDGRILEPDAILCATGYRTGLEGLVGHLGVLRERGRPRYHAPRADPTHPGLWLLGFASVFHGSLFARSLEAEALAEQIASSLAG